MKLILRSTRSKIIAAVVAVAVIAGGTGIYSYAYYQSKTVTSPVSSAANVDQADTPDTTSPTTSPTPTTTSVATQQVEASSSPATSDTPTPTPSDDPQLDARCDGVTKYIDHFMAAQSNGQPIYSSADEFMNDVTKKNNPTMYMFYQQCVTAGKI